MLLAPLTLALFSSAAFARGEPFAGLAYEPALERAQREKKLLLVDFTASWCGPCKKMEKDTWAAAEVRAWLGENAIAIQVDVDEERVLAQRFKIEAMPTVVAVRDGQEFDRVVGYRNAAQFLDWSRDVRAGKRASDALLARSKELRESTDVDARYKAARELAQIGQSDEALVHYLWLWPATRSAQGYGGVRLSFMLSDMARLAQKHEPARKAFAEIFAGLQASVDSAEVPSFTDWQEWTAFCQYFGGNARIVAWYEKHRDAEGRLLAEREDHLAGLIVSEVFDVLIAAERARDAVGLYDDARERARSFVSDYERALTSSPDERYEDYLRRELVEEMGKLHGALLLVERPEEAKDVAALLLAKLDTADARLGLVRHGLAIAGKADPSFTRWLDEAEAQGGKVGSLRTKLQRLELERKDGEQGG